MPNERDAEPGPVAVEEPIGGDQTGLGRTGQPWLLPGFFPGRPRGTAHLRSRLTAYGLPSRRGRNSALMDLAAQMPPAVLSQVLGVGIKAATQWADAVGRAQSEYAADISRGSGSDREPNKPCPSG